MQGVRLQVNVEWWSQLKAARWLWVPVLAFVITRLGIAVVAYTTAPLVVDGGTGYHYRPENTLLDVFGSRWDTGFYLSIATEGYRFEGVPLPSVAFFPLLPLLIRAFTSLVGDSMLAGLIVTNGALLLAMMLLYLLVEGEWGAAVADRTVWYMLIFPASFFGSAIYTESLFLLTTIAAVYLARQRYWESAALAGFAAALTRFVGIIAAPMLLVEWWMQRRQASAKTRPPLLALLAPVLAVSGTVAYMFYLNYEFGDPLAFAHASAAWDRVPRSPLVVLLRLFDPPAEGWTAAVLTGNLPLNEWIDLIFWLIFMVLGGVLLYQRRWSEGVFVILGLLIPFNSGLLLSHRRYAWVLFPAFILLARWGERLWVDRTIVVLSILGLGILTALFANWYWVA